MTFGKGTLAAVTVAATAMMVGAPANATIVATIQGAYDYSGYDTPELDFMNTSGGDFINAQMVLTGYQPGTLNYGDDADGRSSKYVQRRNDRHHLGIHSRSAVGNNPRQFDRV